MDTWQKEHEGENEMKVKTFWAEFANGVIIQVYRSCRLRKLVRTICRSEQTHVVRFWKGTEIVAPWEGAEYRGWIHDEA